MTILDRRLRNAVARSQRYAPAAVDLTILGRSHGQDPFRQMIERNLPAGKAWPEANPMGEDCGRVTVVASRVEEAGTEAVLSRNPLVPGRK